MSIAAILGELETETATTRRVLERVPNDKLSWKPHPKSMSPVSYTHLTLPTIYSV